MVHRNGSLSNMRKLKNAIARDSSLMIQNRRNGGKVNRIESASQNGNSRRVAQITLPDGSETTAYIPRGVKGVKEGSLVLIRASRTNSRPEVDQRVVKPLNGRVTARQKHSKNDKLRRKSYKVVSNMAARKGYRGSLSADATTRERATRRTAE